MKTLPVFDVILSFTTAMGMAMTMGDGREENGKLKMVKPSSQYNVWRYFGFYKNTEVLNESHAV